MLSHTAVLWTLRDDLSLPVADPSPAALRKDTSHVANVDLSMGSELRHGNLSLDKEQT